MTGTLWALVGATGSGKTALSLALAEQLADSGRTAEIVNADAMQLYKGMNIGTAKLHPADRRGISHHLFEALEPSQEATVAWYQPIARSVITEIHERGHDAIVVGGSGLYVSSLIFNFQFPPRDEALRASLERELVEVGVAALAQRLHALDPAAAAAVDSRNGRRVVRALEVAALGQRAHGVLPTAPEYWHPHTRTIAVHTERAELVARLDRRVEQMWSDGLLQEVRGLMPHGIEHVLPVTAKCAFEGVAMTFFIFNPDGAAGALQ